MKVYLKVKIKSLAAEARIIRLEEHRHKGDIRSALHQHRIQDVRNESRAAFLAYGFLRGRPLKVIENKSNSAPNWKRVEDLVKKYGSGDIRQRMQLFSEWCEAV